jgi:hypothetical protein
MSWTRTCLVLVLAMTLTVPSVTHAQRCRGCEPEDTLPRGHIWPALGVHVGTPQKASAALGVVIGEVWQKEGHEHSRNLALFAEPGISAGRASLAYLDHGYGSFGSGFGVAATVLRTWKDPWTTKSNLTYVGGDVLLWPIVFMGPRIGVFRRVAGDPTSKKWFFSVDIGIGL